MGFRQGVGREGCESRGLINPDPFVVTGSNIQIVRSLRTLTPQTDALMLLRAWQKPYRKLMNKTDGGATAREMV